MIYLEFSSFVVVVDDDIVVVVGQHDDDETTIDRCHFGPSRYACSSLLAAVYFTSGHKIRIIVGWKNSTIC